MLGRFRQAVCSALHLRTQVRLDFRQLIQGIADRRKLVGGGRILDALGFERSDLELTAAFECVTAPGMIRLASRRLRRPVLDHVVDRRLPATAKGDRTSSTLSPTCAGSGGDAEDGLRSAAPFPAARARRIHVAGSADFRGSGTQARLPNIPLRNLPPQHATHVRRREPAGWFDPAAETSILHDQPIDPGRSRCVSHSCAGRETEHCSASCVTCGQVPV